MNRFQSGNNLTMICRQKKWFYWLPVVVLCLAIFVSSSFPSPEVGPVFPLKDKLLHMAVYATLAALFARAYRLTWPERLHPLTLLLISAGFATIYGLSDELHQHFVTSRHADAMDGLANLMGSLIGAAGYVLTPRFHGNHRRPKTD
jgi:VanZ family protein